MPLKNGKTTASLQTTLVGSVIPPGTIAPFGGGTVPAGWLLCDGSLVSRSTYSALFSAVGTVHGQGDGSTTFHLPDYRGRFLRGADDMGTGAAGRDPGDSTTASNAGGNSSGLGSVQGSAYGAHYHNMFNNDGSTASPTMNLTATSYIDADPNANINYNSYTMTSRSLTEANLGRTSTDGNNSETRPQNGKTLYIIKV